MPWNKNSSLQLQDMYDQIYPYLIGTLSRDTTLRILGQIIIAQGVPPDVTTIGLPLNSSSPKWIAAILDLKHRRVMQIVTRLNPLLEVENGNKNISIQHPPFLEFLLDRTRSQDLFVDLDEARLVPSGAPAIIRWISNTEGTLICQLPLFDSIESLLIHHTHSKVFEFLPSHKDSFSRLVEAALTERKSAALTSLLSQTLPNIIFGEFQSLVQSAPWDRHPITVKLKQIYANLRVSTFHDILLTQTELIFAQESGVPGFGESDLDTKLQMFWDTFTWETLKFSPSTSPRLTIQYANLI